MLILEQPETNALAYFTPFVSDDEKSFYSIVPVFALNLNKLLTFEMRLVSNSGMHFKTFFQ